jgi:hypothetical protein
VRRALFKYSARGISGGRLVEFPKGIDQQNVQNVTRPPSRRRTCTCMELLRDLFCEAQTAHW